MFNICFLPGSSNNAMRSMCKTGIDPDVRNPAQQVIGQRSGSDQGLWIQWERQLNDMSIIWDQRTPSTCRLREHKSCLKLGCPKIQWSIIIFPIKFAMYGGMPHFQTDPYPVCGYPWHPFKLLLQDSPRMVSHDTPIVSILGRRGLTGTQKHHTAQFSNWKHTMATDGNSKCLAVSCE